jgi:hypothetical protein
MVERCATLGQREQTRRGARGAQARICGAIARACGLLERSQMTPKALPHYLRTVRALALVSGVAGVTVVACSSSPSAVPPGSAVGPEDAGPPGTDAAPVDPDGAPPVGVDAGPEDAGIDAQAMGIGPAPQDASALSDVLLLGIGPAPGLGEGSVK